MNTQSKTTIILISIFILGILVGIVVDRTIIENQMKKRFVRMRDPQMIGFLLERVIQPTPEQQEKIEKILAKYTDEMFEKRHEVMKQTAMLMDSLRSELEPILTKDQKKRLQEHNKRFEIRGRGRGSFRRPMRPLFNNPPEERFP